MLTIIIVPMTLQISDRIITPTGRTGTIATPPYRLDHYAFIHFDDGAKLFMLRSILREEPIGKTRPKKA